MKGSRREATDVLEMLYGVRDMHSSHGRSMTVVRALLPRVVPGNTKELHRRLPPPSLRVAERNQQLSGSTSRKKWDVSYKDNREAQKICGFFLAGWGEKGHKRPRLEGTSGLKREDSMFRIRHFYLQPKW